LIQGVPIRHVLGLVFSIWSSWLKCYSHRQQCPMQCCWNWYD